MRGLVNVCGVCSQFPICSDQATGRGLYYYGCWPMSEGCAPPCSHYLTILGVPGLVDSAILFELLAPFGVYSYKWITYFLLEGGIDGN